MNNYQYTLTTTFIFILIISIIFFLIFYKHTKHPNPAINIISFIFYIFYIVHHFNKRYISLNNDSFANLKSHMIKDIHEKSNNVAVIMAAIFSLLMYLNSSRERKTNNEQLIYATKCILLSLIFGMVLPSLLIHDIDLHKQSIKKLCIYDLVEFSLETISILFFIQGLYISYLTL